MVPDELFQRYQELQAYVGWSEADAQRVRSVAEVLEPGLLPLIDDFYAEIEQHPHANQVITGGQEQVDRLKQTLLRWVHELLIGPYDRDYVVRRWQVGRRHVEIGLDQVYTNVALSRLRTGLIGLLGASWRGDSAGLVATIQSLNKLLDLDLAEIEDAYQSEHLARQQRGERLAAIGQVAGGVAHELRNPLNVVRTSVYYLINARNPTEAKKIEHLRRIEQQVAAADGVITALSNFARMPLPNLSPFNVETCIKETLATIPLDGSIHVDLDFPSTLPDALGDADQIRIAFANLIRNARDAMSTGGVVTITGRPAENMIEVAFADTGVGIKPEDLHRIMEPLYSTKPRGLGLGLALSRAILDRNKAGLQAISTPGQGSTFTVRLITNRFLENASDES